MIIDQWDAVISNVMNIGLLKGEYHYSTLSYSFEKMNAHWLKGVHKVFDPKAGFNLNWLIPFLKVTFSQSVRDKIMGHCTPCSSYYKHSSNDDLKMGTKRIEVQWHQIWFLFPLMGYLKKELACLYLLYNCTKPEQVTKWPYQVLSLPLKQLN